MKGFIRRRLIAISLVCLPACALAQAFPSGPIAQAVEAPAVTARLAPLGILQSYAGPEQMAAEIREEFNRVSEMARKTGLAK